MRVLVAGGAGFLGRHLVERLREVGHEALVASRSGPLTYKGLGEVGPVDAVVNLAGESIAGRWSLERKRQILDSRIETTRRLIEWMEMLPSRPSVFLSASGVGYYGDRPGETLTESSPIDPACRFRAQVCEAWETEALRAETLGARVIRLRFGTVLDPKDGLLAGLVRFARRFPLLVPPSPGTPMAWVALPDAVRMTEFLLKSEVSGAVNVTAPKGASLGELARLVGRLSSRPVVGGFPSGIVRLMLGEFAETILDRQAVFPGVALEAGFTFSQSDLSTLAA